jgi:hypothetical protein
MLALVGAAGRRCAAKNLLAATTPGAATTAKSTSSTAAAGDDVAGAVPPSPALSISEVAGMLKLRELLGDLGFGDLVFGLQVRRRPRVNEEVHPNMQCKQQTALPVNELQRVLDAPPNRRPTATTRSIQRRLALTSRSRAATGGRA